MPTEYADICVNDDLSLSVFQRDGSPLWQSSKTLLPSLEVATSGVRGKALLADARDQHTSDFRSGKKVGKKILLHGYPSADIALELTFVVDAELAELGVEIAQVGGSDTVLRVDHLYRFEKPVADGGHLILPHGSGYLVPADCPDELPGKRDRWCDNNMIGERWTLPLFGMVRGGTGMCIIVDTWWDCEVKEEHVPGDYSALDIYWIDSLGKLDCPRCFSIRFGDGLDYQEMARIYREMAEEQGLLRTLAEKAEQTPVIRDYIDNILYRWPAWNDSESQQALDDIRWLRESGFGVNFFFPKWSSQGYSTETGDPIPAEAGWQAYLLSDPVPGGWPRLKEHAEAARKLGCPIQMMLTMPWHFPDAPQYDEERWPRDVEGNIVGDLSIHYGLGMRDARERLEMVMDNLDSHGAKPDVLYFDGYSAFTGASEDYTTDGQMTRRRNFEAQNGCFGNTRRRGIMPGAELARFWCIGECDYFFYTDWSADRLVNTGNRTAAAPVGQPIPLFQLVFHDCYIAGFSGGGYAEYSPGVDWWADRNPRLYELLYASAPAYNWLPGGRTPVQDWGQDSSRRRLAWLRRWNAYYRAIAMSRMASHSFLSADRTKQCIEFGNGVGAEFDMAGNRFRVTGVAGFSREWEAPEDLYGT